MKSEIACNGRTTHKSFNNRTKDKSPERSGRDDEWDSDTDGSLNDEENGSEDVVDFSSMEIAQSVYQRASEYIITERALPKPWFSRSPSVEVEIQELSQIVDELLQTYRDYFNNVVKKEPWCEQRGVSDFKKIAKEVLNRDDEQANWTRIAMLLALATRVAQRFYEKGASRDSVRRFSRAVGWCIQEQVNSWEERGDRWEKLRRDAESKSSKSLMPLFGAGAVLLSFMTVIVQFTMTTPVFLGKLKS